MTNSLDPDETAVSSGSTMFAQVLVLVYRTERVKENGWTFKGNDSNMEIADSLNINLNVVYFVVKISSIVYVATLV